MDKYELDNLKKTLKTEIKAELKADLDLVWDDEDQTNKQRQFNKQINYNVLTQKQYQGWDRQLMLTMRLKRIAGPKPRSRSRLEQQMIKAA